MLVTQRVMQRAMSSRAKSIGFIGLGAMGREMAANLLAKTFQENKDPEAAFIVYDAVDEATTKFLNAQSSLHPNRNILAAHSPGGVAAIASTIITMVPSSPHVKQIYEESNGILQGLRNLGDPSDPSHSTLCIDSTTLDPLVAVQVADQVKQAGLCAGSQDSAFDMVDAPVSGGVVGARSATLSFMVGSNLPQSFKHAESTLLKMGSRAIHCGKNGNGLVAKIANNLLLGISMLATSEAMLLGTTHGLSAQVLAHIINTSTGRCWSSEVNNPCPGALRGTDKSPPAERNYEGGFATRLQAKDLGLAMSAAKQSDLTLPIGAMATKLYEEMAEDPEWNQRDFSVAFQALKSKSFNVR